MERNIIKKGEVVGQIDYHKLPVARTVYIQELAIFTPFRRKGYGIRAIWDLFEEDSDLRYVIGISTGDSIPFWNSLGADFSDKRSCGDCVFAVEKHKLINIIRARK